MQKTSEKFFKNIELEIEKLANTYELVSREIEEIQTDQKLKPTASSEDVEFAMLIKLLDRAITAFKREIKASLNDYFFMKDAGILREQSAIHIKIQIDTLHKKHSEFLDKRMSEDLLKKGLGRNYYFHQNMDKFTYETLLEYFELNYAMAFDEK